MIPIGEGKPNFKKTNFAFQTDDFTEHIFITYKKVIKDQFWHGVGKTRSFEGGLKPSVIKKKSQSFTLPLFLCFVSQNKNKIYILATIKLAKKDLLIAFTTYLHLFLSL